MTLKYSCQWRYRNGFCRTFHADAWRPVRVPIELISPFKPMTIVQYFTLSTVAMVLLALGLGYCYLSIRVKKNNESVYCYGEMLLISGLI
jgi:hypothetical protein